jgi:dipeptidase D
VIPFRREERKGTSVTLKIRDYRGGHSGNDIQNQRGNAHKDMARILYALGKDYDIRLMHIEGGMGANVIAKDCTAEVIIESGKAAAFAQAFEEMGRTVGEEYFGNEPDMKIMAETGSEGTYEAMDAESTRNVIGFIYASPNGVQTMDRSVEGAVETSLNPGVVKTLDSEVRVSFQCRSSVDSKLIEMMNRLQLCCDFTGAYIDLISEYPAWPYKPESELRPIMVDVYKKMYGEEPEIFSSHGGLEGGILMGKKPDLDIVCLGPNLRGVHTPDERMDIESVQRTWDYVKAILAACR